MWWCLIFDFTFSIFACFCCSFVFQFPSFFLFFFFSRFCAPHYMCYSWIIYVSASHDSWPKNNSFFFLSFLFFLFFAVFCCLSHANLNRDPSSDEHIIEPNWMSISVVSPCDPRSGVTRPTRALLSSAQLDVRNWPPWSFGLVWRSTDL